MGVFIYFIYFQLFVGMPDEIILPLWLHTKKWYCPATQPSLNSRFLVFWWNTAARDLSSSGGLLWLTMNLHQWMMWLMIDLHWGTFKMRIYVFISIIFLGEWIIRGTNVCHTFSPGGGGGYTYTKRNFYRWLPNSYKPPPPTNSNILFGGPDMGTGHCTQTLDLPTPCKVHYQYWKPCGLRNEKKGTLVKYSNTEKYNYILKTNINSTSFISSRDVDPSSITMVCYPPMLKSLPRMLPPALQQI